PTSAAAATPAGTRSRCRSSSSSSTDGSLQIQLDAEEKHLDSGVGLGQLAVGDVREAHDSPQTGKEWKPQLDRGSEEHARAEVLLPVDGADPRSEARRQRHAPDQRDLEEDPAEEVLGTVGRLDEPEGGPHPPPANAGAQLEIDRQGVLGIRPQSPLPSLKCKARRLSPRQKGREQQPGHQDSEPPPHACWEPPRPAIRTSSRN